MPAQETFNTLERQCLLGLARRVLSELANESAVPEPAGLPPKLTQKRACFVTLTLRGALRGCVGQVLAQAPLYRAVMLNARNAAVRDPRFAPVQPGEVADLKVEVSVLTEPQRLRFGSPEELLEGLHPHEDGVLLEVDGRLATFLPQVWDQIPDKGDFLNHLAGKAGCKSTAWRDQTACISIYQVESFHEN